MKETVATIRQNRPLLILCVSNLIFLTGIFGLQASRPISRPTSSATRAC